MSPRRLRMKGFTLLEIVFAFGLFAFCVTVLLVLMSGLLQSSQESTTETRAAQIARQILNDLSPDVKVIDPAITNAATADKGIMVLGGSNESAGLQLKQIDLNLSADLTETTFYTVDGTPTTATSDDRAYKAVIRLSPLALSENGPAAARQVVQVRIDITMAHAPADARPFRYISRLTPQRQS